MNRQPPEPEYLDARCDRDWYNALELRVEGLGWDKSDPPFTRLPPHAFGRVPATVWANAQFAAGVSIRFETDATSIDARWSALSQVDVPSMPRRACTGVDLYEETEHGERWVGGAAMSVTSESPILCGAADGLRRYRLYLPLFACVSAVKLCVPTGSVMRRPEPLPPNRSICFYGTSIVHGASVSRPGMAYPAQIGRRLGRPTLNLGFSGSGKMETAVTELLGEVDAALYVVDCLPNMDERLLRERFRPFLETLRKRQPETPIAFVNSVMYADAAAVRTRAERVAASNRALADEVQRAKGRGMAEVYLVQAEHLLGTDGEATADGTHPSDLGMSRLAEGLAGPIAAILDQR